MFVESPDTFLDDFGVPCSKGTTNFQGILNEPDQVFDLGGVPVQSTEYTLTYRTASVGLVKGDAVTVDGVGFVVRRPPDRIDDGAFSITRLTKP